MTDLLRSIVEAATEDLTVVCGLAGGGRIFVDAVLDAFDIDPALVRVEHGDRPTPRRYVWPGGQILDYVDGSGLEPAPIADTRPHPTDEQISLSLVRDRRAAAGVTVDLTDNEEAERRLFEGLLLAAVPTNAATAAAISAALSPATGLIDEVRRLGSRWGELTPAEVEAACESLPGVQALREDAVRLGGRRLLDLGRVLSLLRPMAVEFGDEWAQLAKTVAGRPYSVADVTVVLEEFPALFRLESRGSQRFVRPASTLASKLLLGGVPVSPSEHFELFGALRHRAHDTLTRTDIADEFVARQVPRQAVAAGALPELLEDPVAVLCSDVFTLLDEIEADPAVLQLPLAKVVSLAAYRLLGGVDRASQLELAALRLGLGSYAARLDAETLARRWRPLWAEAEATHTHRTLHNLRSAALVVTGVRGEASSTAFAGFSDGTIWRLHPFERTRWLATCHEAEVRALDAAEVEERTLVACGTSDHAVAVLDGTNGTWLWRDGEQHAAPLSAIAVSAGPQSIPARVFSAGVGGEIVVHELLNPSTPAVLHAHGTEIRGLAAVECAGRTLVAYGAVDGAVGVLDADSGRPLALWKRRGALLNSVDAALVDEDLVIVAGSYSGEVMRMVLPAPAEYPGARDSIDALRPADEMTTVAKHRGAVNRVRFRHDADASTAFSCSSDRTWKMLDLAAGSEKTGIGHVGPIWAIDEIELDDRRYVVTAGGEGTCRLWLTESVAAEDIELARSAHHHGSVCGILLLGDGNGPITVVTGGAEGDVRVAEASRTGTGRSITRHAGRVSALAFWPASDPTGSGWVISGSLDGALRMTSIGAEPFVESRILGIVHEGVTALSVGALGGELGLVSGGLDGTITSWDVEARQPRPAVDGCEYGPVQALCHVGIVDKGAVVVGGQDGTLSVRSGPSLEEEQSIRVQSGVLALAPLPGLRRGFVAGLADGNIAVVREVELFTEPELLRASDSEIRGIGTLVLGGRLVVACAGLDRRLHLYDLNAKAPILEIDLDGYALCVAASGVTLGLGSTTGSMVAAFGEAIVGGT